MRSSIFACGFRSQFLLAGVAALLLVPVWATIYVAGAPLDSGWPPTLWHAHEMLFGFIASAMAGFLLTAVPSWTGEKGISGAPLVALALLWLSARILIATASLWAPVLPAVVDLAFLPLLAIFVAIPLLRSNDRNIVLLVVLGVFWLTNLVFHLALSHHDAPMARHAIIIGIDLVLLLVTVIGGRIVPAFTAAALRQQGIDGELNARTPLTIASALAMGIVIVSDVFWLDGPIAGYAAGIAAIVQLLCLLQWRTWRTLRYPLVWVLHLGYAWLPVGLALKCAALVGGYGIGAFWLHALTIGALTTMIMAVMTRASLGHTARKLIAEPLIIVAYALLTAAALVRVFGLSLLGLRYPLVIGWAAFFWAACFSLFLGVYVPILWGPRVDGKPG